MIFIHIESILNVNEFNYNLPNYCSQRFCFIPLLHNNTLKYVDIVPIYIGIKYFKAFSYYLITQRIRNLEFRNYSKYLHDAEIEGVELDTIGFIKDDPLEFDLFDFYKKSHLDKDDLHKLRRGYWATKIGNRLVNTNTKSGAFVFGIDAPWGVGKTSLMNMIKANIIQHKPSIVVDFNPWMYSSDKNLISAFIDELRGTLKQFDLSLSKKLIDYSKILSAFDSKETKITSSLLGLFNNNNTLYENRLQIINAIKNIKRPIFVFIDDLDRLDSDELIEMMKLIRNISEFPYLHIVAAYDKTYLVQCIGNKMKINGTLFVEKIFQYEFHIPPVPSKVLRELLFKYIAKNTFCNDKDFEYFITEDKDPSNPLTILFNIREVKRLANHFLFSHIQMGLGVNMIDLLLFELFKIKYPLVYAFFERNIDKIIVADYVKRQYILYSGNNENRINIIKFIEKNHLEFNVNDIDQKSINDIFCKLFDSDEIENKHLYKFNDIEWFNRYINIIESEKDIPDNVFINEFNKDFSEFKETIIHWMINKSYSLIHHLLNYETQTFTKKKKMIQSLLLYSLLDFSGQYIDDTDAFSKINELSESIFSSNDIIDEKYQMSIIETLSSVVKSSESWINAFQIIGLLYKKNIFNNLSFINKNIVDIPKNFWVLYLENNKGSFYETATYFLCLIDAKKYFKPRSIVVGFQFDKNSRSYFNKVLDFSNPFIKESIDLLRQYIESNILDIIPIIIFKDKYEKYSIVNFIMYIYKTWENFYNAIDSLVYSVPIFDEFKLFIEQFEKNGYKSVRFSFNLIKPQGTSFITKRV